MYLLVLVSFRRVTDRITARVATNYSGFCQRKILPLWLVALSMLALLSDTPLLVQINLLPVPQLVPGPDLKADAMGGPSLIKHL